MSIVGLKQWLKYLEIFLVTWYLDKMSFVNVRNKIKRKEKSVGNTQHKARVCDSKAFRMKQITRMNMSKKNTQWSNVPSVKCN
jgi:hypothetical protein